MSTHIIELEWEHFSCPKISSARKRGCRAFSVQRPYTWHRTGTFSSNSCVSQQQNYSELWQLPFPTILFHRMRHALKERIVGMQWPRHPHFQGSVVPTKPTLRYIWTNYRCVCHSSRATDIPFTRYWWRQILAAQGVKIKGLSTIPDDLKVQHDIKCHAPTSLTDLAITLKFNVKLDHKVESHSERRHGCL